MVLFLFESTHAVIKAEKICLENGIKYKIIPVPRSISSQCGMSVEVEPEQKDRISQILDQSDIAYKIYS